MKKRFHPLIDKMFFEHTDINDKLAKFCPRRRRPSPADLFYEAIHDYVDEHVGTLSDLVESAILEQYGEIPTRRMIITSGGLPWNPRGT